MKLLRAANHRRMPWKNGGGVTTEIAVFPVGAGLEAFAWRLSMATVAGDGPFSLFAGVDRTLAVLEGEGILLSVEGCPEQRITPGSPPVSFAADRPTSARLISGPVSDFNVMTRRGVWTHRVERLALRQSAAIAHVGQVTIVFCAAGSATISQHGKRVVLETHDAAVGEGAIDEIASNAASEVYVVTLERPA